MGLSAGLGRVYWGTEMKLAEWRQKLSRTKLVTWTDPQQLQMPCQCWVTEHLQILALLGLVKMRLDRFNSKTELSHPS